MPPKALSPFRTRTGYRNPNADQSNTTPNNTKDGNDADTISNTNSLSNTITNSNLPQTNTRRLSKPGQTQTPRDNNNVFTPSNTGYQNTESTPIPQHTLLPINQGGVTPLNTHPPRTRYTPAGVVPLIYSLPTQGTKNRSYSKISHDPPSAPPSRGVSPLPPYTARGNTPLPLNRSAIPDFTPTPSRDNTPTPTREIELQDIQERVDNLKSLNLSVQSKTDLERMHDLIVNSLSDLENIQHKGPSNASNIVHTLQRELITIKDTVNVLKMTRHPSINKSGINEEQPATLNDSISNIISKYVDAHRDRLIGEVASCVLSEYTQVGIKCVNSKTELKRSITGIKGDLHNLFSEKHKVNEKLDLVQTTLTEVAKELTSSCSTSNENFSLLYNKLQEIDIDNQKIKVDITHNSNKVNALENRIVNTRQDNNRGEPQSVTPAQHHIRSSNHSHTYIPNTHDNIRGETISVAPTQQHTRPNTFEQAHDLTGSQSATLNKSTGIPSHHNLSTIMPAPNNQNALGIPPTSLCTRNKRNVLMYITLAERIINIDLSDTSKADTMKIVSFDLKKLLGYKGDLKSLQTTLSTTLDFNTLEKLDSTLFKIEQWETRLDNLQKSYYLHLSSERSLLSKVELLPFNGSVEGDTIYNFLNVFNSLADTCHSPEEKSQLLFKSYLSDPLKLEVEPYMPNFESITQYLINEYGDCRRIAAEKRRKISSLKHPSNPPAQVEYLKQVESLLLHCEALASSPHVNATEILSAIHNSEYVNSVVSYLPKNIINMFSRKLEKEPRVPHPSGSRYFTILKDLISSEWRHISRVNNLSNIKENEPEHNSRKNYTNTVNQDSNLTALNGTNRLNAKPLFHHECPFYDKHRKNKPHNLGTCVVFFKGDNSARMKLCSECNVCCSCLRRDCTLSLPCSTDIPKDLLCPDCPMETSTSRIPNVLCCLDLTHTKPTFTNLQIALGQYLKVINFDLLANFQTVTNLAIFSVKPSKLVPNGKTYSSPVDPNIETPAFDCTSGNLVKPNKCIKHLSKEDFLYIFQTLNVDGEDILCFYDSGASGNLVLGPQAEKLKFKVETQESEMIGCLGNRSVYTMYGRYLATLGPDRQGTYHEMKFQGINQITSQFPLYNFTDISEEVRNSGHLDPSTLLPHYAGGKQVDILIGIKSPALVPQLLFWLPSGIGIFKMPFVDKFGSSIAYGGSHKSITQINRMSGSLTINTMSIMLSRLIDETENLPFINSDSFTPKGKPPLIFQMSNEQSSMTSSTPLTGHDIVDIIPECIPNRLVVYKEDTLCNTCCCHNASPHSIEFYPNMDHFHKSKIPLAKMRESLDPYDELVSFRCEKCEMCQSCKQSNRLRSSTLKERVEQRLILKSIKIDYKKKRIFVQIPFLSDPVAFFRSKFGGTSNYKQALSVYLSSCKKPAEQKLQVKNAFQELEDLGFIQPITTLTNELQTLIRDAPVQHFYPWRPYFRDSIWTPVRIVVDPTASWMNLICAKGDSNLASMFGILLDARCKPNLFCADIRKLYNNLYLLPESYPYSLFLYSKELDPNTKPEVWLMRVAWYGHISTGAQATTSLKLLGQDHKQSHPDGSTTLLNHIYVDDCLKSSWSKSQRETEITEVQQILENGGMKLKYVIKSGEEPPAGASTNGKSISLLGYSYATLDDTLSIASSEINFQKRRRGSRPNNPFPAIDELSIEKLILSLPKLTRRQCLAKSSELFDTLGLIEPYKASLKRALSRLNLLGWEDRIPDEEYTVWKKIFSQWPEIQKLKYPRSCVPSETTPSSEIRLISCSDASADCSGAALYLSVKLGENTWSCQLLTSKSQLCRFSIPKNELCGLVLAMELIYAAVISLTINIGNVIVCVDSLVALCWASNVNGRSKVFVQNRVITINRYITWINERLKPGSHVQLCHIPGELNPSDLLTKGSITPSQIAPNTPWTDGYKWMTLNFSSMPVKVYSDITVSKNDIVEIRKETTEFDFPYIDNNDNTPFLHIPMSSEFGDYLGYIHPTHTLVTPKNIILLQLKPIPSISYKAKPMLNIIEMGWIKANKVMSVVSKYFLLIVHNTHLKTTNHNVQSSLFSKCILCNIQTKSDEETKKLFDKTVQSNSNKVKNKDILPTFNFDQLSHANTLIAATQTVVDRYWDTLCSIDCKNRLSKSDLESCYENPNTGILYYKGRVNTKEGVHVQDLDLLDLKFIDATTIKFNCVPILPDHPIMYSFSIYVHTKMLPHSGIDSTLREICKRFYPLNARRFLSNLLSDCIKCRIVRKKILKHEMAEHSQFRFTIAPPFSFSMIDLAQPFRTKSRFSGKESMVVPVLCIVCILTGALGLYICEDWSTESVVQALIRHSSRYGPPSILWVDSGSQMIKLKEVKFKIRDLNGLLSKEYTSAQVIVAPPKSHTHQGRIERKISHVRDILERLGKSKSLLSYVGWESLLAGISNTINSLPICRPSSRSVNLKHLDIITPNHLLIGYNSSRVLASPMLIDVLPSACLNRTINLQENFYELLLKRSHLFIPKSQWYTTDEIFIDDLVLFFIDESAFKPRNITWHYARVLSISGSRLTLNYSGKILERSKRQVVRVCAEEELDFNSSHHSERLNNRL